VTLFFVTVFRSFDDKNDMDNEGDELNEWNDLKQNEKRMAKSVKKIMFTKYKVLKITLSSIRKLHILFVHYLTNKKSKISK
jgi:hypothetical protein